MNELQPVLTVKEVAQYLRVNTKTVYNEISKGNLPGKKIGRRVVIPRDLLQQWLSSGVAYRTQEVN